MPEMIFLSQNDAPTAPLALMGKKLACLQIASVLHAASVCRGRAHDASSKGKSRPLSSKDTTSYAGSGNHGFATLQLKHCRLKCPVFHRYLSNRQHTAYHLYIICSLHRLASR